MTLPWLRLIERVFAIFSIIIYSGGFLSLIRVSGASEGETDFLNAADSPFTLITFQAIYLITFFLLILRWKKAIHFVKQDKLIWCLVGFGLISFIWSFDPRITLVRGIALLGSSMFGLYLASRYSLKEQMELLGYSFAVIVFLSFILALGLPKYGVMSGIHAGAWRGIYNHKNVLGKMMVLGTYIVFLLTSGKTKIYYLIQIFLSVCLLALAKSASAIVSFLILVPVLFILKILRWKYNFLVPSFFAITMAGGSLYLVITGFGDTLLNLAGKDMTLTGRSDLWSLALNKILNHFWLGYGYGAFWTDTNRDATLVRYAVGWSVPNAHNGFLDLLLDLGFIGFGLLVASLLVVAYRCIVLLRKSKSIFYIWPLLFLTNMAMANLTETTLMVRNDLFWIIYISIVLSIPEELQQLQQPVQIVQSADKLR
jgi:O-antigen ligase